MGNSTSPQKIVTTFFCNRINSRKVPEGLWEKRDATRPLYQQNLKRCFFHLYGSRPKSVSVFLNQVPKGFILDRTIKILACNHSGSKKHQVGVTRHLGT